MLARKTRHLACLLGMGLLVCAISPASACTSFMLQGNDGGRVYGRTMEWGQPLNSEALLIQRGTSLVGSGAIGGDRHRFGLDQSLCRGRPECCWR